MSRVNLAPKSVSALIGTLMIASLLVFVVAAPAQAETFDVDRTDDPEIEGFDCTAAPNDCSLRNAISRANSEDDRDRVNVPAGTYTLSIPGVEEDLNRTGDLDIRDHVDIVGAGARTTIVDAAGIDRVFEIVSSETATVISGLTITGGSPDVPGFAVVGGGVKADFDLTLREVTVDGNEADFGGGVYFATQVGASMRIERSTISNNVAREDGGGILNTGIDNGGSLTIDNSTVANNRADIDGGGLNFLTDGTMAISNSTFVDNTADADNDGDGVGGGLSTLYNTTFRNTIVARNTDAGGSVNDNCEIFRPETTISQGFNLEDQNTCEFDQPTDDIAAPLLGTLADNGGSTDTVALLPGSSAIDTGNADVATDQRGVNRPQNGDGAGANVDDRGAFELEFEPVPPLPQCSDGTDNDSDGDTDFPADPGCDSATDNDESATPSISINDVSVIEGNQGTRNATFTLTRSGDTGGSSSVQFSTANSSATAPSDYQSKSGTVNFSSGQTEKNVTVLVNSDTTDEPNERFFVEIGSESEAEIADDRGTGTIEDDDEQTNVPPGCTIVGTSRNDVITGTPGNDTICGLGGNDRVESGSGNDTIIGGPGNDTMLGGSGADTLRGGTGKDVARGEAGNDTIGIKDSVRGNDSANGGTGTDSCASDPKDTEVSCES